MDNDEKDKEIPKSEIAYQYEESPKHQSEVEYLKNISKNTDRNKNNCSFLLLAYCNINFSLLF